MVPAGLSTPSTSSESRGIDQRAHPMTVVLLHGNPETPAVWAPLVDQLVAQGVDPASVHVPQLPGFGCASPPGFGATKDDYVEWFLGVLEGIVATSGPADLVLHDWGGGIGMRAVALRPDLVRTWSCDVLGLFHPDYVWHDFAQIWQTPDAGEAYFEQVLATPVDERIAGYEAIGITRPVADELARAADAEMGRCVLALYRSAAQPAMAVWGADLGPASSRPGLALLAPHDPFVRSLDLAPAVAESLGARCVVMADQGHWWMLGDPAGSARTLTEFWRSV